MLSEGFSLWRASMLVQFQFLPFLPVWSWVRCLSSQASIFSFVLWRKWNRTHLEGPKWAYPLPSPFCAFLGHMASGPITSRQIDGETVEIVTDFIFLGSKITADGDCSHEIKRCLLLERKVMTNLDSILKKQRHYFANRGPSSQGYGLSCGHVWMWELDCEESWEPKNWCFWTVVLEKTFESPLDFKEIQPVHSKGDQCWIFIGRTDAEAETPILWPVDAKNWLFCKDPDAGKDWKWEEKGMREDEMVGWHHRHNGHGFE